MIARLIYKCGIVIERELPEYQPRVSLAFTEDPTTYVKTDSLAVAPPRDKRIDFEFESWVTKGKEAYYRQL